MLQAKKRYCLSSLLFFLSAVRAVAGPVDDLQPGYWYQAPNSKLDSVAADLPGTTAVMNAWNGGAYDTVNDRLIAWGGGHTDYDGNEIYVFSLSTMQWSRHTEPSQNTNCNFATNQYPDGAPCSMHTYDYVDFHPGSQSFVILGGASPYPQGGGGAPTVQMYSFANNAWRRGADRSGGGTLQGASSAYDPNRDVFWVLPSYDQKFSKFDPDANGGSGAWTQYGSISQEIDAASAIDPDLDVFVVADGNDNRVRVFDLTNPNAAPITVTTTGDDAPEQTSKQGFEWDPVSEKFVAWIGGTSVYTLTPPAGDWKTGTWVWDEVADAPGNTVTPTSPNSNGTYSRWRYVPSKNVFILANRTSDNVFFYKLSEGGGDPPPDDAEADWLARSTAPGVVYANDFNTQAEFDVGVFPDSRVGNVTWDSRRYITGGHSIRFDILKTDSENSGNWRTWLRPDGVAFADGDEFYVQYSIYVPAYHLGHVYLGGGGWKTSILSEHYASFTNHEIVLGNNGYHGYVRGYYRGRPSLSQGVDYVLWDLNAGYLGCGGTDPDFRHQPMIDHGPQTGGTQCEQNRRRYGGLYSYGTPDYGESALPDPLTGAATFQADEWQTLLQHVKVGHFDQADSTVETWFASDGEPYQLLYKKTDAILGALEDGENGYEAIWLTPFDTGKDPDPTRQDTFMNYDQLIVSTQFIEAPGVGGGGGAPTVNLSADPLTVVSGGSTTLTWSTTNATTCTASGNWTGSKALNGSQVMSNLTADKHYVLSCTGPNGTAQDSVDVTVTTSPAPTVTLTANPTTVVFGGSSTLTWSSTNATSCTASGNWSGSKAVSGSQVMSNITANKHYVLTCTGAGGSDDDDASVTVGAAPPVVTLTAAPTNVPYGGSSTLSWSATNATSCTASGDWSGSKAVSGSQVMSNLTANKRYVLTCTGTGGSDDDDATVSVTPPPAPTVSLNANPTNVAYGGTTALSWTSTDATGCTASGGWSGSKPVSGNQSSPALTADTTFTLTCSGAGGSGSDSVSVSVEPPPPAVDLDADPDAIDYQDSTTLTWSAANAEVCVASGDWSGVKATEGSESTGPLEADSNFSLTCVGEGGRVTDAATVAVGDPPPQQPTVVLTADPSAIEYLGYTTLTWSSTHATQCTASGAWTGARALNGSELLGPLAVDSVFTLTCTGSGGSASRSITVEVAQPPDPPTLNFSVSPQSVPLHGHATLTWSTTNVDGCMASGGWNGARGPSGTASTGPIAAETTFSLSCTGSGGTIAKLVTVEVLGDPLPPPDLRLSAAPGAVEFGETTTLTWNAEHADWCTASGAWSGVKGPSGSETSHTLTADSVFTLSCFNQAGRDNSSITVSVEPPPMPRLSIQLSANPDWVDFNGMPTLTWEARNADSCEASGAWNGPRATSGSETPGPLSESSQFVLTCTSPDGTAEAYAMVAVGPPEADPWLEIGANPSAVSYGGEAQLAWSAANVDECVAAGGWSGVRPSSGSEVIENLIVGTSFTLICTGPAGTVERTVSVAVGEPSAPTLTLDAEPASVIAGAAPVLTWSTQNVDACVASGGWSGERTPNGIESGPPLAASTDFVLECIGPGGSISAVATVEVREPSAEDSDHDGMSDEWEQYWFGDLSHDGAGDEDGDALDDAGEYAAFTNPTQGDTDGDGSGDYEELYYGSNPVDGNEVWTAHRPLRPEVDASEAIELRGGVVGTLDPYADPDGDALDAAQWQVAVDEEFTDLVLDRLVPDTTDLEVPMGALDKDAEYWARTRHYDNGGLPSEWSEPKQIRTAPAFPNDSDGDDVDDDYQVEGFADTNVDGVDDSTQGMCNLYDAEGFNVIGFGVSRGRVRCFTSIGNGQIPDGDTYASALQYGMFAFAIDDLPVDPAAPASVQVTVYLPEDPTTLSGWYKFDEANGLVSDFSAYSSVQGNHMTLNLVDGGAGDQDGVVNGVILDPSGPAIVALPPPPPPDDDDDDNPPSSPVTEDGGGGGGAFDPLLLLALLGGLLRRRAHA